MSACVADEHRLEATEREAGPPTDSLRMGILLLVGMTVVQKLVGFVRNVLFCRWLVPHQIGYWELALSFFILASPLVVGGLPGAFGRYTEFFRLTSDNEASPVSILEAMCCGRPVVATNVGSISESVQDGFSGILVEPGDVDAMSQAWLAILANPRRGRQMGRIGREAVVTHSSLNRMVESYEDLITSIYQSKCSAPHLARDPAVQDAGLHARGEETISPLDAEVVHVEESDEQEVMQPAS